MDQFMRNVDPKLMGPYKEEVKFVVTHASNEKGSQKTATATWLTTAMLAYNAWKNSLTQ